MIKTVRQRLDFIGPFDWAIMGILLGLFIGAVFGSRAAHVGSWAITWPEWWDGFLQNSGTEMLGAFLTFVLLELVRGSREKQEQEAAEERRTDELKKLQQTVADELQKQIRGFNQAKELAQLRVIKTPEERQVVLDSMKATGLLAGADLLKASLEGVNLRYANLKGAVLLAANLEGTLLHEANLEGALLSGANLARADLRNANLVRAGLENTNLDRAVLRNANLERARLRSANLKGAYLQEANLDEANFEGATLPNGTKLPGRLLPVFTLGQAAPAQPPEPDWRTPFEAWDQAGRPRIEPADLEPENGDQS